MPHIGSRTSSPGWVKVSIARAAIAGSILAGCAVEPGTYRPRRWVLAACCAQSHTDNGNGSSCSDISGLPLTAPPMTRPVIGTATEPVIRTGIQTVAEPVSGHVLRPGAVLHPRWIG